MGQDRYKKGIKRQQALAKSNFIFKFHKINGQGLASKIKLKGVSVAFLYLLNPLVNIVSLSLFSPA